MTELELLEQIHNILSFVLGVMIVTGISIVSLLAIIALKTGK